MGVAVSSHIARGAIGSLTRPGVEGSGWAGIDRRWRGSASMVGLVYDKEVVPERQPADPVLLGPPGRRWLGHKAVPDGRRTGSRQAPDHIVGWAP